MKDCMKICVACELTCKVKECRYWIDYDEDKNCCLISIDKHGQMTLMQVAERLGVSHVRIKQIQDKALIKLKKNSKIHE